MLGKQIIPLLPDVVQITHRHYDLTDMDSCRDAFENIKYSKEKVVIHLAGFNGGIGFSQQYPADIFYETSQINLNVLRCCQKYKVDKVISVLASCAYPDLGEKVLEEKDINSGLPNETIEAHSYAKRLLLNYSRQLHKQHGLQAVCAILTNCYGPGDRFALDRTKVVGAVVKKVCDAKLNGVKSLTFFGTGTPKREIMFARDAAKALVGLLENYDDYMEPVNIASDTEVQISELVYMVCGLVGYDGDILWDDSKPDGQMRKKLCTKKMKKYVDFEMTPLEQGLQETINYYMEKGRFLER